MDWIVPTLFFSAASGLALFELFLVGRRSLSEARVSPDGEHNNPAVPMAHRFSRRYAVLHEPHND